MEIALLNSNLFSKALADYFYLIDHNYPEKGALKLVGDRYQLPADLRNVLYRGISSSAENKMRSQRLVKIPGNRLLIDGYNVILTLLNYRQGRFVFISTDNICRDAGSLFGKIRNEQLFSECTTLLVKYLLKYNVPEVVIYLDSPVSYSLKHKHFLLSLFKSKNIEVQVEVVHSADFAIRENKGGTVSTSDSVIIDSCKNPIIDLPRLIIQKEYGVKLFDIGQLLSKILSNQE